MKIEIRPLLTKMMLNFHFLLSKLSNTHCTTVCKDSFIDSGYTDIEKLNKSIEWYSKCYKHDKNVLYGCINLATLRIAHPSNGEYKLSALNEASVSRNKKS